MIAEFRTFLAVVRWGTFAGAGETIGLTQSAVSSQIKRLEDHVGFALFDRTGRSSTLNQAGKDLVPRIEALVRQFDALANDDAHPVVDVKLRVGAITTAQMGLLVPAFAQMLQLGCPVRLHIVPGTSIELMDQLDAGALDAALMVRPPFGMYAQLVWQPLVYEPYAVLAPSRWKASDWAALLREHPFIRYERSAFGGRMAERFLRKHQLKLQEVAELDDLHSLYELVRTGVGASVVPITSALYPLPKGLRVWSLGADTFYREIGILRQRTPREPQWMAALVEQLQQQAAAVDAGLTAVASA